MDILVVDMQRDVALNDLEESDWWSVDLCFDEASFPQRLYSPRIVCKILILSSFLDFI